MVFVSPFVRDFRALIPSGSTTSGPRIRIAPQGLMHHPPGAATSRLGTATREIKQSENNVPSTLPTGERSHAKQRDHWERDRKEKRSEQLPEKDEGRGGPPAGGWEKSHFNGPTQPDEWYVGRCSIERKHHTSDNPTGQYCVNQPARSCLGREAYQVSL
ncbi:hypothetical protein ZHAS_00020971 [Anopheles sinensis]|uniref:Uncharacterized protein n=1 Tax=Anopheles sinensis TaxID=74873 RepID=A0A084WR69_ANOSI|nr:hypothetical protein ZHAS_00020971 [Anopheles sinensis]